MCCIFYRPIPEKDFVEGYIKAYYLPESQLDVWLQDHKVFTVTGKILVFCHVQDYRVFTIQVTGKILVFCQV